MREKWDPVLGHQDPRDPPKSSQPSRTVPIAGTPSNPLGPQEFPWDQPGTTGIPRDVMREKDFSEVIISFLYLKSYSFYIIKISQL